MTFNEFLSTAIKYWHNHPEQRFGQAIMNSLGWVRDPRILDGLPDIWEIDNPIAPECVQFFEDLEQMW
jgi:hypothetical protein